LSPEEVARLAARTNQLQQDFAGGAFNSQQTMLFLCKLYDTFNQAGNARSGVAIKAHMFSTGGYRECRRRAISIRS
jgi:hypothetical protein